MNAHRFRVGIILACLPLLIYPAQLLAQLKDPNRQILIMAKPGVVSLSEGHISGWLEEINIEADVRNTLLAAGVNWIVRAMPQFTRADTLIILPDGRIYRRPDYTNLFIAEVPIGKEPSDLAAELSLLPSIEYAELRRIWISPMLDPNDEHFSKQWNMSNDGHLQGSIAGADVRAIPAWSRTTGSSDIKMAIIDGGIRYTHNDFKDEFGNSRIEGDTEGPVDFHGTCVAGIAAATGNNGKGIAGMDWECTIINERMTSICSDTIGAAIQSAVLRGARAINMSWGFEPYSQQIYNDILDAYYADVMIIAATPYQGHTQRWPNHFGSFMHDVAASNFSDDPASYMTIECPFTDLAAPGGDGTGDGRLYTTRWEHDDAYDWVVGGTSVAAPHSTGLATLMLTLNSSLHNYDIEWLQKKTADGYGDHDFKIWGYGRLNADKATEMLKYPYELTQGPAWRNEYNNVAIYFVTSPNGYFGEDHPMYLDPGWYSPVDVLEINVDIEYDEPYWLTPLAWLSHTGFSRDIYNDPESYNYQCIHEDVVSKTHLTLRTYFYYLLDYQVWVPFDPYDAGRNFRYTRVGIPESTPPWEPPTAPTGLFGDYNPRTESVELEWDRNPEWQQVNYYQLDRADEDGEFYVLERRIWDPGQGDKVEWIDRELEPGVDFHRYRAKAHNAQGWGPFCYPITVWIGEIPPDRSGAESAPEDLTLEPNYPNPFNPTTLIKFGLPSAAIVRLQVINIRGQTVRILVNEEKPAGWHVVTWDGKNEFGRDVASGIYLYMIEVEGERILRRMTLIR